MGNRCETPDFSSLFTNIRPLQYWITSGHQKCPQILKLVYCSLQIQHCHCHNHTESVNGTKDPIWHKTHATHCSQSDQDGTMCFSSATSKWNIATWCLCNNSWDHKSGWGQAERRSKPQGRDPVIVAMFANTFLAWCLASVILLLFSACSFKWIQMNTLIVLIS